MELSIIIVNFNVKYFLHICLESLLAGSTQIESEIIVVDNASSDGSVDMIRKHFPSIKLIANLDNIGFGQACNQGVDIAQGRYVLFVNPDTLIGESLLCNALNVFQEDSRIGAVGVCLLDGNGQILRESKRSIPTLWSAFTKFSGLSDIFRYSSFFNGYYAPELGYDQKGDIEVLPGAFMLIRKKVLDELKGFDPRFFMYAEDIDLSYRITKAGYRIRYDGELHVIHFKGESTQKELSTYTNTFYHSMQLFINKYRGELYDPLVANLLQIIVGTIQGVQKFTKMIFSGKRPVRKFKFPAEIYLLTKNKELEKNLQPYMKSVNIPIVPEQGIKDAPFYLRYTSSFIRRHPKKTLMLDHRSLTFDQIVNLWKMKRKNPYYIVDGEQSFFISSHNKEKQGEVHNFEH